MRLITIPAAGARGFFYSAVQISLGMIFLLFYISGCKKFVTVDAPITAITGASVYSSDATATAVLTGIYTKISSGNTLTVGTVSSMSLFAGLSADEFSLWSGVTSVAQLAYYANALSANTSYGTEYWYSLYPYIFSCNSAIEGLNSSSGLTPAVKQELLGEAKFMRAFFYFYLVNMYGDIPMPLTSNYTTNAALPRTSKTQVYQQIVIDLKDARDLLNSVYTDASLQKATTERTRPTRWAAAALLARVYLYIGDWPDADAAATTVIDNSSLFNLNILDNVFTKNNSEAIWQLQPVNSAGVTNTYDGYLFIIPSTGPSLSQPVAISDDLLRGFEVNDNRKAIWINSIAIGLKTYYFPHKYKANAPNSAVSEYLMMLRLGEQYLIRAEARAQQGKLVGAMGAIQDLNMIRSRAGLSSFLGSIDNAAVVNAIVRERRVELFSELGNRWFDLKRAQIVDSVMTTATTAKGGTWNTAQKLYPISLSELLQDPHLSQNVGY